MPFQKGNKLGKGRPPGSPNRYKLPSIDEILRDKKCNPVEILIEYALSTDPKKEAWKITCAKELLQYAYPKKREVDVTLDAFSLEEIEAYVAERIRQAENNSKASPTSQAELQPQ